MYSPLFNKKSTPNYYSKYQQKESLREGIFLAFQLLIFNPATNVAFASLEKYISAVSTITNPVLKLATAEIFEK